MKIIRDVQTSYFFKLNKIQKLYSYFITSLKNLIISNCNELVIEIYNNVDKLTIYESNNIIIEIINASEYNNLIIDIYIENIDSYYEIINIEFSKKIINILNNNKLNEGLILKCFNKEVIEYINFI